MLFLEGFVAESSCNDEILATLDDSRPRPKNQRAKISDSPSGLSVKRHWERGFFPFPKGYGRNPGLKGGVSNRSWFYDEQVLI
ncbi:MAG: hypothetical protein LBR88_02485 [Zoogloeaceae bacterium]|jgi:hypothetical protein|nr:hypothetical protein [Zoogloeaceae bacterium]